MNYSAQLLDELAAQYALGTLRHAARMRFERLCSARSDALAARQRWEDRLLPLDLAVRPANPSADVWLKIQRRVGITARPRNARRFHVQWWQGALAASLLLAVLVTAKLTIWNAPSWQPVAVLAQANQAPLWKLERSADSREIQIRTLGVVSLPATQSYELWVLPTGEGHPVSLGLLPRTGAVGRALTRAQQNLLLAATKVAVSIEPLGGSPTGLPTGPVVIVAVISRTA